MAFSGLAATVPAHEPIFGVGPHTLYKGGIAVEVETEIAEDTFTNVYEAAYGITPDLSITAQLPLVYGFEGDASRLGVGDVALRLKWRFLRLDSPGASDGFAIVGGIKFPTGASGGDTPLGTGSTDLMTALTYGHEARRWYWWADMRHVRTTEHAGVDRGDVFLYDAAFGFRPWRLTYEQPDLVILMEINGRHIGAASEGGSDVPDTGGDILTTGPAVLFSYRNYMFKAGIAFPIRWSLAGSQPAPHMEGVIALEAHF